MTMEVRCATVLLCLRLIILKKHNHALTFTHAPHTPHTPHTQQQQQQQISIPHTPHIPHTATTITTTTTNLNISHSTNNKNESQYLTPHTHPTQQQQISTPHTHSTHNNINKYLGASPYRSPRATQSPRTESKS